MTDAAANRRPLQTRSWKFFGRLADGLAKAGVSPNAISVSSVFFGAIAGGALAATGLVEDTLWRRILWFAGAMFVQLRLIANLLDGMVAVEGGKASAVGELYNEIPDRISDPAILVGVGFAWGGCPILGLTAALASVFVAYVRAIGASAGVGQVFLGPFAKPQRMALITLLAVAGALVPTSWQPIHSGTGLGPAGWCLAVIIIGCAITAIRRLRIIAQLMRERVQVAGTSE